MSWLFGLRTPGIFDHSCLILRFFLNAFSFWTVIKPPYTQASGTATENAVAAVAVALPLREEGRRIARRSGQPDSDDPLSEDGDALLAEGAQDRQVQSGGLPGRILHV